MVEDLCVLDEWPVSCVQKVALGTRRRQLTFAVDKMFISAHKRGSRASLVVKPGTIIFTQETSAIASVEVLPNDPTSFKVTWKKAGNPPAVLKCETATECANIIAKIRGIMDLLNKENSFLLTN